MSRRYTDCGHSNEGAIVNQQEKGTGFHPTPPTKEAYHHDPRLMSPLRKVCVAVSWIGGALPLTVNRGELHALIDRIPEDDLSVTRKLLLALAVDWDVAPADSDGEFTDQASADIDAAEAFFNKGGEGIPHQEVLKEFG